LNHVLERGEVLRGLLDHKVAEVVHRDIGVEVGLRQGDKPDAWELVQRLAVIHEVVLESQQSVTDSPDERLEVLLFLPGVVEQLLPVDKDHRDLGAEQCPERVDPA